MDLTLGPHLLFPPSWSGDRYSPAEEAEMDAVDAAETEPITLLARLAAGEEDIARILFGDRAVDVAIRELLAADLWDVAA